MNIHLIRSTICSFLSNIHYYLDTYFYVCHSLTIVVSLINLIGQNSFAQSQMCVYICMYTYMVSLSCLYKNNEQKKKRK